MSIVDNNILLKNIETAYLSASVLKDSLTESLKTWKI